MRIFYSLLLIPIAAFATAAPDQVTTPTGVLPCKILEDAGTLLVVETVPGDIVALRKSNIIRVTEGDDNDFYLMRGTHLEKKKADERAVLEYLQVLKRDPDNSEAGERIDSITRRHKRKRWEEGMLSARQLLAEQEYKKALEAFQDVLAENPDDDLAKQIVDQMCQTYAKIAYHYYNHCYDEGAIRHLAKAEELNPQSAEIYYVLGLIHHDNHQFELARQEYERALELDPTHVQARSRLLALIERQRAFGPLRRVY